jgi:hypothetical protein
MKTEFTKADFEAALKNGAWAWPGGYPIYFICSDGEALSFEAASKNARLISEAIEDKSNLGWRVVAADVNWEDETLICCHSNVKIPSAYGVG